ncbi:MAG: hypothetical protein DME76_11220 [Verrucomicrobia bacterium]|nr:MAG: hypothetical protein DME76_11220 [Verrucomicrobiota bacterium]
MGNFFYVVLVIQSRGHELAGKEVTKMNNMKLVVSVLFLGAAIGLSGTSARADMMTSASARGVISQDVLTDGSYCHTKFEAIREDTLASSRPVLKDSDDFVDFYGPCNHDPLGKDEVQAQKIEAQHRFANDYED